MVTGPLGSVAGEPDRRQRQLLCLLPVQVAGDRLARRCVCSAHRPSGSMQVHAPAWGATRLKTSRGFFHPDSSSKFCISPLFLTIFLGESLRKGSQHCFILRDILFRGNYVTNRCPGSARNSGSAAAGPGNGSRLVNASVGPGTGFPRSLLPAAQHIVLQSPSE